MTYVFNNTNHPTNFSPYNHDNLRTFFLNHQTPSRDQTKLLMVTEGTPLETSKLYELIFKGDYNKIWNGVDMLFEPPSGKVSPYAFKPCFDCTNNLEDNETPMLIPKAIRSMGFT